MSEAGPTVPGEAAVPQGLISSVVSLVGTGPVLLGAYTIAELTAVDAIVDFLESRPSDEVLAEAVRSLAARQLLVAGPPGAQVQVRGDLGIAVAFQQRARMVLDARATGTEPGEPWRILLLPQPERICLVIRIDALGVHELGLYTFDEALGLLDALLPRGPRAEAEAADGDIDGVLAAPPRSPRMDRPRSRATAPTWSSPATRAGSTSSTGIATTRARWHPVRRTARTCTTPSSGCWPSAGQATHPRPRHRAPPGHDQVPGGSGGSVPRAARRPPRECGHRRAERYLIVGVMIGG